MPYYYLTLKIHRIFSQRVSLVFFLGVHFLLLSLIVFFIPNVEHSDPVRNLWNYSDFILQKKRNLKNLNLCIKILLLLPDSYVGREKQETEKSISRSLLTKTVQIGLLLRPLYMKGHQTFVTLFNFKLKVETFWSIF